MEEHFPCKEDAVGSNPTPGSKSLDSQIALYNVLFQNKALDISSYTGRIVGKLQRRDQRVRYGRRYGRMKRGRTDWVRLYHENQSQETDR